MSGQPGQRSTFWTTAELDILKCNWPKGGYALVKDLLPHRTHNQLRAAAYRLQLRVEGHSYVKQPATEWIDAAIVRAYRTSPKSPNLKALAKSLGRTLGWIKWRAQILGVARVGIGTIWTPEENNLLESGVERGLSAVGIHSAMKRAGYCRSISAIVEQINKQGMTLDRPWWTARDTAKALNVEEGVIGIWIKRGWLKAKKTHGPTSEAKTDPSWWAIDRKDLRQFLLTYPRAWDHRRVRIEMLLEMLCFDSKQKGLGSFKVAERKEAAT